MRKQHIIQMLCWQLADACVDRRRAYFSETSAAYEQGRHFAALLPVRIILRDANLGERRAIGAMIRQQVEHRRAIRASLFRTETKTTGVQTPPVQLRESTPFGAGSCEPATLCPA